MRLEGRQGRKSQIVGLIRMEREAAIGCVESMIGVRGMHLAGGHQSARAGSQPRRRDSLAVRRVEHVIQHGFYTRPGEEIVQPQPARQFRLHPRAGATLVRWIENLRHEIDVGGAGFQAGLFQPARRRQHQVCRLLRRVI